MKSEKLLEILVSQQALINDNEKEIKRNNELLRDLINYQHDLIGDLLYVIRTYSLPQTESDNIMAKVSQMIICDKEYRSQA